MCGFQCGVFSGFNRKYAVNIVIGGFLQFDLPLKIPKKNFTKITRPESKMLSGRIKIYVFYFFSLTFPINAIKPSLSISSTPLAFARALAALVKVLLVITATLFSL